ncbi:extended synaptotagmin-2-A-like [Palaemon carinicauda]|uniref:extended synaptotagmin-2-A-like n=1 Tax=Palaemon carinicauda TaxID=392227 RepID=UPI0035B5B6EC
MVWFPETCTLCYELLSLLLNDEADEDSLKAARTSLRTWVSGFGRNAPQGCPYLLDGDMASRLFPGSPSAAVPTDLATPLIEVLRAALPAEDEHQLSGDVSALDIHVEPMDEQMDVKLSFDLRYGDLIGPERRSSMELSNRYIPTFDRAIIALKKINKLDTWNAEESTQGALNDAIKRRYLAAVKDVIQTYFPLDLLMDTSTPGQEQSFSRTLQIRPPEPEIIPDIQNTPILTSMRLGSGYQEGNATSSIQRVSSQEVLQHNTIPTTSSSTPQLQRTSKNTPIQVRDINTREKNDETEDNQNYLHLTTGASSNLTSSNSEAMMAADPKLKESVTKDCIVGTGIDPGKSSFGTIQLTTKFQAPRSLIISIHKLRNLPKRKGKIPHPYVKLVLQSQDELVLKESTEVLDKTTDPVFEKSFKFQLDKPLPQYTLKVTAKTKHKFTHALGQVLLSFTPISENIEERKWYKLYSPKSEPIPHEVFYNNQNVT